MLYYHMYDRVIILESRRLIHKKITGAFRGSGQTSQVGSGRVESGRSGRVGLGQ